MTLRALLVPALLLVGGCQHDHAATDASMGSVGTSPVTPQVQALAFFCGSVGLARSTAGYHLKAARPRGVKGCTDLASQMRQAEAFLVGYQLGSNAVLAAGEFRTDELPTVEIEEAVKPTVDACNAERFDEVEAKLTSLAAKCDAVLDRLLTVCRARGWTDPSTTVPTDAKPPVALDLGH